MSDPADTASDDAAAAAALERFRQTGIRLDRQGRFWHEGGKVEHEGLRRAFLRWLDVLDDGRPVLRLDENRYAYLDVEDAPLLVTAARWRGDRAFVTTNDGVEQELAYGTLQVKDGDALYCRVRAGKLEARVTTPAYYVLASHIVESAAGFALEANGRRYSIAGAS